MNECSVHATAIDRRILRSFFFFLLALTKCHLSQMELIHLCDVCLQTHYKETN